jgi:hypothetical protein
MRRGALGFIRGRDELDVIRVRLLLALLAALLGSLVVSSVVHADACTYDVSQLARVEFHVPGSNGSHRVGGASATQPESSSGAAERTIPLVATFVATNNGGGVLPPPSVSDSKLQNLVNNLWKGTANSSPVGNGTTADAVRHERATGQPVGGKFHTIKAQETVNGLRNWLNNNPNASYSDRLVAQSLLDDLLDALNCVP